MLHLCKTYGLNSLDQRMGQDFKPVDTTTNDLGHSESKSLTEFTEAYFDYSMNLNLKNNLGA